jgi:hypothetical protein
VSQQSNLDYGGKVNPCMFKNMMYAKTSTHMLTYTPQRFKKQWYDRRHHIKRWKMKEYPCIPDFMQTVKPDPFDYKLRNKAEVEKQMICFPLYPFDISKFWFDKTNKPIIGPTPKDHEREEFAIVDFDMDNFRMSTLQKERMQYLLGSRYKGSPKIRMVIRQYDNYKDNLARSMEIFYELILESLRAPDIDIEAIRNPNRMKSIKLSLGKTLEERREYRKQMKQYCDESLKHYQESGKSLLSHLHSEELKKYYKQHFENVRKIEEGEVEEPTFEEEFGNLKIHRMPSVRIR